MQRGITRDVLPKVFVGYPAHIHTIRIETNTVTTAKALGILEKKHLPTFTIEISHLVVRKKPSICNASVYLGNLYL